MPSLEVPELPVSCRFPKARFFAAERFAVPADDTGNPPMATENAKPDAKSGAVAATSQVPVLRCDSRVYAGVPVRSGNASRAGCTTSSSARASTRFF